MKETENSVIVTGVLSENALTRQKTADGREYITGFCAIKVNPETVIKVHALAFRKTKSGGENKAYAGLEKVIDTFKSITSFGEAEADRVSVFNGQIELNDFYSNGNLISTVRIKSNFFSHSNAGNENCATFTISGVYEGIEDEVTKDGKETGRGKVKLGFISYGSRVNPLILIVESKDKKNFSKFQEGTMIKLRGNVVFTTTTVVKEMDFGDPEIKTYTKSELIVTGGSQLEDEVDEKEYKELKIERKNYLASLKEKAAEKKESAKTSVSNKDDDFNF